MNPLAALINLLLVLMIVLVLLGLVILVIIGIGYLTIVWYRNREREKHSLDSTLLQIALPRDNEIKIDAAEQLFASFAGIKTSGRFAFLKYRPHLSFEIVGMPGDIRFYIYTPNKYKDMVEKQINASYPDAEIKVVEEGNVRNIKEGYILGNEYNIFSKEGQVAFATLKLRDSNYKPIKVYKDLVMMVTLNITLFLLV